MPANKNHCLFIPTLAPRATLVTLPPPDGSRTFSTRREESLSGFAVTCGRTRRETEAIVAPLAGGSLSGDRAKPATEAGDPSNTRVRGQGGETGTGLWRT